ncbi:tRNA (guanine-N(7)-)-methyltransferase non-catalytic subunit WDR4-like [Haemaphysalis longicornis]
MALIRCSNNRIALVCPDHVYLYETKDNGFEKVRLTIPEDPQAACSQDSDEDENSTVAGKQAEPGFSCANFSPCSTYFMAVTHSKRLLVWKRRSCGDWVAISQRCVARKCVQVRMCATRDTVLVADRSGDVYSFGLDDPDGSPGQRIVGRLSMVLDMVIGDEDSFVAVSDRDEKIQVSCFPNCYNIRTFCLGHTQFVTSLALLPGPPQLLVSGSGDGTVRTWCPETGRQLHHFDITAGQPEGGREPAVKRIALEPFKTSLACLLDGVPEVLLLSWNGPEAGWSRLQKLDVPCPPDDVAFDEDGQLWVLLGSPASVQLFHHPDGGCWQQRQQASTEGQPAWTGPLLGDASQALHGSLQGRPAAQSSLAQLYKQWFPNERSYQEQKKRRLAEAAGPPKRARAAAAPLS